jgi:hypothetical protein
MEPELTCSFVAIVSISTIVVRPALQIPKTKQIDGLPRLNRDCKEWNEKSVML